MLVVYPDYRSLSDGSLERALSLRGVPSFPAKFAWWMSWSPSRKKAVGRMLRNLRSVQPLSRKLSEWGCSIVVSNSTVIPIGGMVAATMRLPHVWYIREFGDLDYGLKHDWGVRVFTQAVASSTAKIAVSEALRAYVLPGKAAARSHVVYCGIAFKKDFDRFLSMSRRRKPDQGNFTFAIVGLIRPSKGQEEAIRAFALVTERVPNVRLLIVGDGHPEYVQSCKALAASLGIADSVDFWGYLEDPFRAFIEADVVLMCSRNEAMGQVTLEAMAACRPVIGFDSGGTSELVLDGHNGLLYRDGSRELADCMHRLALNRPWAQELGMNGWEIARQEYSIERCAERVLDVLQSAMRQ